MIISRGRSYIFVHIPKTGGTAMALALEARAKADDILIGDTPKALRRKRRLRGVTTAGRLWKHATLADIDGLVSADDLAGMFCFTLVRNPWDRMVSYYHWLRAQSFDHPAVHLSKRLSFDDFVASASVQSSFSAAPAAHYMTDAQGTEHCSAFIRLEHLGQDMAPLIAHLGFTPVLDRVNTSGRVADYRSYYTDETAELVANACAEDITRFGYRF